MKFHSRILSPNHRPITMIKLLYPAFRYQYEDWIPNIFEVSDVSKITISMTGYHFIGEASADP